MTKLDDADTLDQLAHGGLGSNRWVLDQDGKVAPTWADTTTKEVRAGRGSWWFLVDRMHNWGTWCDEIGG